ncbi:MAG: hypothetical protein FWF81_04010 [Defluviitaleaceae bacterium]|nr:hypothetical protein [Defluviitaleaceae bacterium]
MTNLFESMVKECGEMPDFPNFPDSMHPWDIVLEMCEKLPPHEQKIVQLMVKLGEAKELLDEIHGVAIE